MCKGWFVSNRDNFISPCLSLISFPKIKVHIIALGVERTECSSMKTSNVHISDLCEIRK